MGAPTGRDDLARRVAEIEAAILARNPEHKVVPTLERIAALTDVLGSPQKAYPAIHITGTNGKTSTARMAETLLRTLGLHTGRYTSPHLDSVRERICLDGAPIEPERLVAAYDELAPYLAMVDERFAAGSGGVPLTYFETLTGMAYAVFADAPVDVAVVEVGMGGSWDATNVLDAGVSVFTPIDLDHTDFLGTSVAEIAGEKAGILKPGGVAVVAHQPAEAVAPLMTRALEVDATVAREGLEFGVARRTLAVGGQLLTLQGLGGSYDEILLPLHGEHQARNAACALAAVEAFFGAGSDGKGTLDPDAVREGFAAVTSPGRLEAVRTSPTILLDAAHNPAGARATAAAVAEAFTLTRLVGVIAAFADKDVAGILEAFEPVLSQVVVTQSSADRAMPVDDLAALAVGIFGGDRVEVTARLDDAIDAAVALAEEEAEYGSSGVLITGSIRTVAEARTLLGRR